VIIKLSWIGTGLFAVTAIAATIDPDVFAPVAFVVAMTLFFIGCVVFFLAYFQAISRSREVDIGIGGLFFLAGAAPRRVQVLLLGALGVQVVIGLVAASVRIYTPVAFALLVPMYGLGLSGLWGATYGTFPPRQPAAGVD